MDTVAERTDHRIAGIQARVARARASTDPVAATFLGDLDYVISRLLAAEAAAEAGEAYAVAASPFLHESFTRVVLADSERAFGAALSRWRAMR